MKMIGIYLVIIGITIFGFFNVYNKALEKKDFSIIDKYIEDTSIVDEKFVEEHVDEEVVEGKNISNSIKYTAIIEIPTIDLKKGVVDSTENFKSINYAISVDKNSKYPNQNGNLILYAHSGSSTIAYFKKLNQVNINDSVYIYFNGIKYQYKIYNKYDIEKSGKAEVISTNVNKYITLITCNQNKKGYQTILVGKFVNKTSY